MSAWPSVAFGDLVSDETGGNIKTLQSDYLPSGRYPVIDQGQTLIGGYTNDASRVCKADLPVIIFGDHTKCFKFVDFPFCLGADGTKILRPKRRIDERYLFYALQRIHIPDAGYSRHFKYLKEGRIPLPPLDEQRRIAAILDQADELRRKRQRAIDRLNQLGPAIFHEMFGDIAGQPRTHTFEEIATIQQSLVDPKLPQYRGQLHVGPEHIASGVGVVNWQAVRTAEEDNLISGKNRFKSGDIIYSKIRPYLNKVVIADRDGLCSADMYVIQPVKNKSNAHFLRMLLMGADFLAYAKTCSNRANIPKLNRSQVESYRFHCPSFDGQQQYAERLTKLELVASPFAASADMTSNLFSSLQHRAFQGVL